MTEAEGQKGEGDKPAAGGRRGSWLRRLVRGVVGLALLAFALLAFAFSFLHTPAGLATARAALETWGSRATGGELRLGRLDLALWKGRAAVTAASLRLDGVTVEVQRIDLDWSPKAGPHVHLLRPRVVVRDTGEPVATKPPATGLAAQPWRALERLGRAEVEDGRLELRDAGGAPWLVLGRFDAEMAEGDGRRRISLRIADAGVGWPEGGLPVKSAAAEGTLALDDGRLVFERARVAAGESSLDVDGVLERIAPITATASLRAAFDGALVEALAPGTGLSGALRADASVEMEDDAVTGTLAATSPALTVQGLGPWAVSGRGRLEGPRLVLESLEASGYRGRLVAEGPLALVPSERTDLRLRAEGIDVAALARAFSGADVPVASRAGGALRWETNGWDVDAARGTGELTLRPSPRPTTPVPGLPLSGSGSVRITGRSLALEGARVEAHGARVTAEGALGAEGNVRGSWSATLPLASVDALLADVGSEARLPETYTGTLVAKGTLAGPWSSPEHEGTLRTDDLAVHGRPHSLEARGHYAAGRLGLAPLLVRSGFGQATLAGSVPVLADAGEWDLRGEVEALDLAPALALAGIAGGGPVTGTLRVEGPREAPRARADLEARVVLDDGAGKDGEPIAVALAASSEGGRVAVERLAAEVAGGRVEGSGRFDAATRALEAKAAATGLDWARLPLLPEPLRRLGGTLLAEVSLGGTTETPHGEAHATLADATLDGAPLPALAFDARTDGRRLELEGRSADAAFLKGAGEVQGDWPVRFEIDVARLPAQALLDALTAGRHPDATIEVLGTVSLDVPLRDPGRFRFAGEGLAASGHLRRVEWTIDPFRVEGSAEEARVAGLRLTTRGVERPGDAARAQDAEATGPAGRPLERAGGVLAVDGRVPFAEGRAFDLAVKGDFTLAAVEAVAPEARASGRATLEARVGGTAGAPDVDGAFGVTGGRLRLEDARVSEVEVAGRFRGREAIVDRASARVLGGSLLATGTIPLATLQAGRTARLHFEATDVDLSRLAVPGGQRAADSPSFLASVSGDFEATAPGLARLRGGGMLTRLESRTAEGTFGLAAPAAWRLLDGRLVQEPLRLAGPLGTLEASADVALAGDRAGLLTVAGPLDLRLLSPFLPDTTLAGPATIDLRARWDASGSRLDGRFAVDGGRVTLDTLSFSASRLKGEVRFLGDRAEIDATAAAGDGTIVAYGGMNFGPGLLGPAAMSIEAERVPVSYPEGFRGRATGAILVDGDVGRYRVSGLVDLTQATYTAELDARRQSLGRLDYLLASLRGQGSILDSLPLAVDVRLAEPLRIRNRQAQIDVTGTVTANGTLAQPAATGQLSLIEGGQVTLRRARIRAHEGRVELNGYPAGVPDVDFEGLTQVGGVTMSLRAQGSMDDLQLDIRSPNRPDLSQTDLVSLLLTGRTSTAVANEGGAFLAEELAAALGGALQRNVGETLLIDVSSDESMLLDEGDPTQRFRIGTRVGQNVSVFYSTRLDGTEQRWVAEWNPRGGRFRFRAIQDSEEGKIVEATDRLSFNVFPGRRKVERPQASLARLDSLRFEGALPLPEEELVRVTRLRVGRRYDTLRLAEAGDRVQARLVEAGFRSASVDEVEQEAERGRGHVDLVLRVEAGPKVVVSWAGDDPGEKARRSADGAWPPYASPEAAGAALARAARVELQAAGHYEARVRPEVRGSGAAVEVVLEVVRGPLGKGVDVVFEGNERLTAEELLGTMPRPGSREFFEALDRPARLVAGARVAYAGLGHVRARVGPPRSRFDASSGRLQVTLAVREGVSASVAALVLPDEVPPAAKGGPALSLREGEPFDVEAYLADRDRLAAWLRSEGWMEARVRGVLEVASGDVRVTLDADLGPRPRLGEIRVVSSGRTHEGMVRRAIQARPGETILPRDLAESRARLSDLGTFSSIDLRMVPVEGQADVRDLEVSYVERPDVELEYGLRYNYSAGGSGTTEAPEDAPSAPSEGRLQAAAALQVANPFGFGWQFGAYTLQTTTRRNYRLGLAAPTLLGRRVRTQLLAFDEADDDSALAESFASRVRGFSLQQSRTLLRETGSRRWHERLRLQWGYTNKDIQYSEQVGSPDVIAGNRAFVSVALIGDERDSLTDPTKGLFWTATTEWSRRWLGSDVDYVRLYGQLFTYVPLPKGLVWAQGLRAGTVPGDDPFYLLENRFQAGGPTTVRGFRQNGLGPQLTEDEGLGGQAVFVMNQEIRFPIWKSLKGGVFWDSGNSWLWAREFSLRDLRHTVGGGLRFMFPFGPVRVEYGFILDRRRNSDGSYLEPLGRFVFGLGHAF